MGDTDPAKNWDFHITCKDCGAMATVLEVGIDWSLEVQPYNTRVVVLTIPQQCAMCANLKLVTDQEEGKDDRTREENDEGTPLDSV